MKHTILVATTNPGKMRELAEMFSELAEEIEWHSLRDYPNTTEVEEDGATFADNAAKKALGYARQTGLWTIADDSGLVVDALGGRPGVHSARFATDGVGKLPRQEQDVLNNRKVLGLLKTVPQDKRSARFVCCMCLASPTELLIQTEGKIEGQIIDTPRGENGFGYDPLFYVPALGKTTAELSSEHKNTISHRGQAAAQMKPALRELLKLG
ncbi:MAG TPA: XTP/dITP diphosphatase [Anaerohalosphaeraceae bacterium]|nr:XTP/dITP diphosphatase [Anaerohalosphaeraceae bacterium]